jgi:hypothetical protein
MFLGYLEDEKVVVFGGKRVVCENFEKGVF